MSGPEADECDAAFRRWCVEELIDPRLEDLLEEAFTNGWIARAVLDDLMPPGQVRSMKLTARAGRPR